MPSPNFSFRVISNDAKILNRRNFTKNAKEHFLLEVFQVAGTTSKSLKLVWSCGERFFTHFARTDGGPGGDRVGRVAMLASASVKALNIIISLRTKVCIN